MENEKDLKRSFISMIEILAFDENNKVVYWKEYLDYCCDVENGEVLRKKVINLVNLLNEIKDTDKYESFAKMDIENEIWYLV